MDTNLIKNLENVVELTKVFKQMFDSLDNEVINLIFPPNPLCNTCTQGLTPLRLHKGPCLRHKAEELIKEIEDGSI